MGNKRKHLVQQLKYDPTARSSAVQKREILVTCRRTSLEKSETRMTFVFMMNAQKMLMLCVSSLPSGAWRDSSIKYRGNLNVRKRWALRLSGLFPGESFASRSWKVERGNTVLEWISQCALVY